MNVTVIGAGNIGGALVRGWSKKGKDINITVSGVHMNKLNKIKDDCPNIEILTDDAQAIKDADIIIIAVKPWQVDTVINDIKANLKSTQILVSLARSNAASTSMRTAIIVLCHTKYRGRILREHDLHQHCRQLRNQYS